MNKKIDLEDIALNYNTARMRLIVLDYDGCLVPLELHPQLAVPTNDLKSLVTELSTDISNHVMIISGRTSSDLDSMWDRVPVVLSAEHGGYYKNPGNTWYNLFSRSTAWIEKTYPCINALTFQYDGSFVERKAYSLSWHYRAIADKVSEQDKQGILLALRSIPEHDNFVIYDDKYTIELRTPGIDKGAFLARWMGTRRYDFIMAMGDGETDEDLFKVLDDDAFIIKVGKSQRTTANYYLNDQAEVLPFLRNLMEVNKEFNKMSAKVDLQR